MPASGPELFWALACRVKRAHSTRETISSSSAGSGGLGVLWAVIAAMSRGVGAAQAGPGRIAEAICQIAPLIGQSHTQRRQYRSAGSWTSTPGGCGRRTPGQGQQKEADQRKLAHRYGV